MQSDTDEYSRHSLGELVRLVNTLDFAPDLLVAFYDFARAHIGGFFVSGTLPRFHYTPAAERRVITLQGRYLGSVRQTAMVSGFVPKAMRDAIATDLSRLSGAAFFEATYAAIRALQEVMPDYELAIGTVWIEGRPLNRHRRADRGVFPRRLGPLRSPIMEAIEHSAAGGVTPSRRRTAHVDALFDRYLVVEQDSYRARVSPEYMYDEGLSLSTLPDVRQLAFAGSCLHNDIDSRVDNVDDDEGARFRIRDPDPAMLSVAAELLDRFMRHRANIIVLPELTMSDECERLIAEWLRDRPLNARPYLVAAGSRHTTDLDGHHRNVSTVFAGDGRILWRQAKRDPFRDSSHGVEDIIPNELVEVYDLPLGRVCILVCADLDDIDLSLFVASLDVDLVLAPTMNPGHQKTSLYAVACTAYARHTWAVVVSANTCAPKGGPDGRPREISFIYVPVASQRDSTFWRHCRGDPVKCRFVRRLSDFTK